MISRTHALAERAARLQPQPEQMQRARIPVPVGGINMNVPASELPDGQSPSVVNMFELQGRLKPDTGYVPFGSGAINGIPQAIYQANHSGGNTDVILVTTKTAYYLSTAGVWTGGTIELNGDTQSPINMISYAPSDWIVITNGIDPVFYFFLDTFRFVQFDLDGMVCRSLAVFHESLLLVGTTEEGAKHLRRVRASDAGNPTAIKTIIEGATTGIAAIYDLLDTDDDLHCAYPLGPWLILYRHSSIMRATYLGALNQILTWDYMVVGEGAIAVGAVTPVTIAESSTYHVVVGNHEVYQYTGSYSLAPIGTAIWQSQLGADGSLNQLAKSTIWCQYIGQWDEVWIGIPTDESMVPDTVLRLSVGGQPSWFLRRFADTFLSVVAPPTRFEENTDQPGVLMCGPGGVFQYDFVTPDDAGMPIKWAFETKDIGQGGSLSRFDRLVLRGLGAYDIGVEMSINRGHSWTFLDTVNFNDALDAVLTFNLTNEFMRFRLSGQDPSFSMTWLDVWYIHEGEWTPLTVLRV